MATIDLDTLLAEISSDSPSGENLEYDPAYAELERLAARKPEQFIESGSDDEPTDWKKIRQESTALLARSKDLRCAVLLARSLINVEGFPGFADGLLLVKGLLENFWDSLHPQLDLDDGNDPTMRINVLVSLADREATLNTVAEAPLASMKGLGEYSLRDLQKAEAGTPAEEGEQENASMATISAAFLECPIEELKATGAALESAKTSVSEIDTLLMEKVSSSQAPDLNALTKALNDAMTVVNQFLERRGEATAEGDGTGAEAVSVARSVQEASGEILSREGATRMMDKIADYFRKHEPSSPVPLLMQRAKRVSNMGFMEIVKDIAPDGLHQAQSIGGSSDTE